MLFALQKDFFDIVHFHGVRNLHFMFAVVGWRTKKQKIPLVAQDHGYRSVGRIEKYMQRYGLSRTNAVLAANQESIDDFISQGFSSKLIYLVPDGFDPEIFYPGPPRLKPSAEPFQILVVSRLSEEKDPFTMAKGIVEVIKRGNLINLTICGNGPLKVQIEKSLKMASVPVKFIDHLPHEDLAEYYRCSDVLVLTSLHEGWPNAIVESIACGLPVIATNVPGSKDCLGEAGILITSRNPIALANALQNLIDNPELGLYYRDLGQKRAKNFTWEAVVKQIEQIYFKFI